MVGQLRLWTRFQSGPVVSHSGSHAAALSIINHKAFSFCSHRFYEHLTGRGKPTCWGKSSLFFQGKGMDREEEEGRGGL